MKIILCPSCKKENKIDISNAIDTEGEIFMCCHCNYKFYYS